MIAFGDGQDAARRLLGDLSETLVLMIDQYTDYSFINNAQPPLCWVNMTCNVPAIADSSVRIINHSI